MSALLSKADECGANRHFSFGPIADTALPAVQRIFHVRFTQHSSPPGSRKQRYSTLNLISCGGKQFIVICVTFGSGPQDAFSEIDFNGRRRVLDGNPCHDIFKRFSHVSDELRCELRHGSTHSR